MKITEIRIDRTKSLGNYENLKLGFTAVVGEDESTAESVERVKKLLDWEINKEERDSRKAGFAKRLLEIADIDTPEAKIEREKIDKWLETYAVTEAEIKAL